MHGLNNPMFGAEGVAEAAITWSNPYSASTRSLGPSNWIIPTQFLTERKNLHPPERMGEQASPPTALPDTETFQYAGLFHNAMLYNVRKIPTAIIQYYSR